MMAITFIVAFVFSFLGSIPPGSINLSVLQLSVDNKFNAAMRFALAAAIVEYPYAFIAVKFQAYLVASPVIMDNLNLIAGLVMVLLGVINIYTSRKNVSNTMRKLHQSGFRKGLIISVFNPLAIPFWVGVTAYLSGNHWVDVSTTHAMLLYVGGISAGTFCLLALLAVLGKKVSYIFKSSHLIHIVPGIVFLILGAYALIKYLISI